MVKLHDIKVSLDKTTNKIIISSFHLVCGSNIRELIKFYRIDG